VKIPLCEDAGVLSWLMHSDDDINSQVLQGCGASKVNDLALWLRDKDECFMAGKLWKMLVYGDHTTTTDTKVKYLRNARQALAKVPAGTQPGSLSLEVEVCGRVSAFSNNNQEKAECLEWMVELNGDGSRTDQLNAFARAICFFTVGAALIGFTSSRYITRTAAPIEQLQRGTRLILQWSLIGYGDWAEHTGFLQWYHYGQLSMPLGLFSICYVAPNVTNDREIVSKILGQEGEKLEAFHALYSFSNFQLQWHLRV
jgi:hypothetical protein